MNVNHVSMLDQITLGFEGLQLPSGHQTSFGRPMDVYMMSVRPSKMWYVRRMSKYCPLDTPIGRPTDVHFRPIQQ